MNTENAIEQKPEDIKIAIGRNLKRIRKEKKLTQVELAHMIGFKDNAISAWENGTNSIDVAVLMLICEKLDVSIEEMYKGIAKNNPSSGLSEKEQGLINLFRQLPEEEQFKLIGRMETLLERDAT